MESFSVIRCERQEKRSALRSKTGSITASPNPIHLQLSDYSRVGVTTVSWTSAGTRTVEVRVGAPDGPLFSRTGPSGTAITGKWVGDGMVFYLQDVSGGLPLTFANTLATIVVNVISSEGLPANCPSRVVNSIARRVVSILVNYPVGPSALRWAGRMRRRYLPTRLEKILEIHGWTHELQLRYLMAMVRSLPDHGRIVEIGVWQGRSALAMAEACRGTGKRVFAIDPWEDWSERGVKKSGCLKDLGLTSFEEVHNNFLRNCRRLKARPWVVPIRARSLDAARDWPYGPVMMIFIDGDHSYDAVTADLNAWFPLVAVGGLICGDDWTWESVRAAVMDFVSGHPECHLDLPLKSTWAFLKFYC